MNRNTATVATIGFSLTLALLVVSAGLSYYNTRQLVEADRMMDHTHRVISLLEAVLSTLKDAETGQRGFIITQEEPYLQPYQEAVVRVHDELNRLKELTSDNAVQQKRLSLLEQKVSVKLDELDRTIAALKRTRDFKAVQGRLLQAKHPVAPPRLPGRTPTVPPTKAPGQAQAACRATRPPDTPAPGGGPPPRSR